MACLTPIDDRGYEIDEAEVAYWGRAVRTVSNSPARQRPATVQRAHAQVCDGTPDRLGHGQQVHSAT